MKLLIHHITRTAVVFFILIVLLTVTIIPAAAQQVFTSDLAIIIMSAPPKHAKACQTFTATYRITNLGPDNATQVSAFINVPDQFEVIDLQGSPATLLVGESAQVTATIKVVAFGFGESKTAWVRATAGADMYLDVSIDPNLANNEVYTPMKLISKPAAGCP